MNRSGNLLTMNHELMYGRLSVGAPGQAPGSAHGGTPNKDHDAPEVREERCNAATALATVNGNEIRDERSHCPTSDGKARRVGKYFGRESGDLPLNTRLCHSSEGEEKETFES